MPAIDGRHGFFIARPAPAAGMVFYCLGRPETAGMVFYRLMKPAARSEARAAASMIASQSMP
jgi:hypothetical protein